MNPYYVTFGQAHTHRINCKTLDKDCVAVIRSTDYHAAHKRAMDIFNETFHNLHESPPPMEYFPRGLIVIDEEEAIGAD